jgi:hypothetical protein
VRRLAEPDMQLPERATAEMHIRPVQHRRLICPQPGVIQRPKQRVVTCGWGVLAGRRDPGFQELEEPGHPLGVGGSIESGESSPTCREALNSSTGLVNRIPNSASNLHGLTHLQKLVETLERLHVAAARRRRRLISPGHKRFHSEVT